MTLDIAMDLQLARIRQHMTSAYHAPAILPKRVVPILDYRAHGVRHFKHERRCSCGRLKGEPSAEMCLVCRYSGGVNHGFGGVA